MKTFKNNSELQNITQQFNPDIIFNDILDTDIEYMKSISEKKIFIVNFEDLGKGKKYANLVFNPIYHSTKNSHNEYYGTNFACVRDEF